jgi:L-iditol 2-dehydrogenase
MQALLLTDYMRLEMTEMPEPAIGPEDVLVRVRACGICGSDVHGLDGSTGRRIPPLVMGHEASGDIVRVGAVVRGFEPGDRVTFDSTIYCGYCFYCLRGLMNLCENREVLGVSPGTYRRHGAFAEYVAVPQRVLYKLPDSLSYEKAAMAEAVSVALHAVLLSGLEIPERAAPPACAVVVGSGMIGSLAIQCLRAAGCKRVVAIDVEDSRLELARRSGASDVFNSSAQDAVAAVLGITEGRGADLAIECVGATAPLATTIGCVRSGATVTLVGNITPKVEMPLQVVVPRQIRLQGSCASAGEYPLAMELMADGIVEVDSMVSAVAPLSEGALWFDRLYRREPNLMKVILAP